MHELSIALSIVESAEEAARKNDATVITKVEVEIGTMAGVETEALLFGWDSVTQGTMAENAPLVIHSIRAEAHCLECGKDFPVDNFFSECPHCKSYRYQVTKGKELRISSLTVDTEF
jgi:hydrogenase nickel incorporation protein HypA/HybF